jgi:signal transduction histidine kinase/CheY-like chemotaxis protein
MQSLLHFLLSENLGHSDLLYSYFDNSDDYFFTIKKSNSGFYEYGYANNAFLKFFDSGISIAGQLFGSVLPPEQVNFITNIFEKVFVDKTSVTASVNVNIRGNKTSLAATILPLFDSENKVNHLLIHAKDNSENLRIEEELIKTKCEAEEANRLKTALLTNMSHEIRTPLNGIMGFAELLRDELDNDYHREMSISIRQSAKRLLTTLHSIMELSRLEAAPTPVYNTRVNLIDLINKSAGEYELSAYNKSLYLLKDFPSEQVSLHVDDYLFQQILQSILENAIKFTKSGGITIRVYTKTINEVYYAFIDIIDTGIGIAENDQKIIFDKFRQVSQGHNRSYDGLGLGLTLAKLMTELLKGEISLQSTVNIGTKIQLKFPALKEFVNEQVGVSGILNISEGNKMKKLLVVEDNIFNQKLFSLYISKEFSLDFADNGETAMRLLSTNKYLCVIMDIDLGPGLNGIDVLNFIRKQEKLKSLPVFVITGFATAADENNLLAKGFDAYISKPFDKEAIQNLLSEFIHGNGELILTTD